MDEPQVEMTCDELDERIADIKLRIMLEKRKRERSTENLPLPTATPSTVARNQSTSDQNQINTFLPQE